MRASLRGLRWRGENETPYRCLRAECGTGLAGAECLRLGSCNRTARRRGVPRPNGVAPQYADPMAGRSPEGLPAASRLVDPTVVPPISEPPSAERTEGQPSLLVAFTGPTMALVPLRRGSQLGRLPVPLQLRPIVRHRLIAIRHPIMIHRPGRVGKGAHAGPPMETGKFA